jgi:hypothetical protein
LVLPRAKFNNLTARWLQNVRYLGAATIFT